MNGTLTASGARLLRLAREEIIAHPTSFRMDVWDCGSVACVAGHIIRAAGVVVQSHHYELYGHTATQLLGFDEDPSRCKALFSPLAWFRRFAETEYRAENVIPWINEFLWSYGYPPDALEASPVAQEEAGEVLCLG